MHNGAPMDNRSQSSRNVTIFEVVNFNTVREGRGWFLGLGIVFLVLGVLAILVPFIASLVTAIVLGWLLVLGGFVQGYHAIQNRRWANSTWALLGAALSVIAGLLIVAFPVTGTLSLTLILAAYFFAQGVLNTIRAIQHREMSFWGWLLFDGLLSVALGILILAGWPSTAVWALGLLVGIQLVIGGSSMLLIGLGARPRARAGAS